VNARLRARVGGAVLACVGLGALGATAFHANTTATHLVSAQQRREADISNGYYNCLEAEGHDLLRANDIVFVVQRNLADWVIITKSVGGWARLTEQRKGSTVALVLDNEAAHSRGGQCDGQALVAVRRSPTGKIVMARAP
jgi:hypothetical protein